MLRSSEQVEHIKEVGRVGGGLCVVMGGGRCREWGFQVNKFEQVQVLVTCHTGGNPHDRPAVEIIEGDVLHIRISSLNEAVLN